MLKFNYVCLLLLLAGLNMQAKIDVGVVKIPVGNNRHHADAIIKTLQTDRKAYQVTVLNHPNSADLKSCQVVILPQQVLGTNYKKQVDAYSQWRDVLSNWVRNGGALIALHDATGYRRHAPPLFPEISIPASHEPGNDMKSFEQVICMVKSLPPNNTFHSLDHVPIAFAGFVRQRPGKQGHVIAHSIEKRGGKPIIGDPLIVFGNAGQGKYLAYGMLPGWSSANKSVLLTGAERQLFFDCINFLASDATLSDTQTNIEKGLPLTAFSNNLIFNGSATKQTSAGIPRGVKFIVNGPANGSLKIENDSQLKQNAFTMTLNKVTQPNYKKKIGMSLVFADAAYSMKQQPLTISGKYKLTFKAKANDTLATICNTVRKGNVNPSNPYLKAAIRTFYRDQNGQLQSEYVAGKNTKCNLTPSWQTYSAEFIIKNSVGSMSLWLTLTDKLTYLPVGSAVSITDVKLVRTSDFKREMPNNITVEKLRKADWKTITGNWQNATSPAPKFKRIPLGATIEAPKEMLKIENFCRLNNSDKIINLNGQWKLKKLPGTIKNPQNDEGVKQGFQQPEFDASNWQSYPVPFSNWDVANNKYPTGKHFSGVGYYRTSFNVPADFLASGKRIVLHFDRVRYDTKAFLNGQEIGHHIGGTTPFQFDVTKALKPGHNVLVVRVYCAGDKIGSNNKYVTSGRWFSGICGNVSLQSGPEYYVKSLLIDPKLKDSAINLRITLGNSGSSTIELPLSLLIKPAAANAKLQGPKGKEQIVDLGKKQLKPGDNQINLTVKLDSPITWDCDYPYLYEIYLKSNDTQIAKDRFGFREIAINGPHYMLNGKRIYFRGVVVSLPSFGNRMDSLYNQNNVIRRMLTAYRQLGCNMIFPQGFHLFYPPAFYDICDELGLAVQEYSGTAKQRYYPSLAFHDRNDIEQRFSHVYNHPSVMVYCIGNESRSTQFVKPFANVYDWIKKLDGQNRPIIGTSGSSVKTAAFKEDVNDRHGYPGTITGHPRDTFSYLETQNKMVWDIIGKVMPIGNWEMGCSKYIANEKQYNMALDILSKSPVDKNALIRAIMQVDSAYHMPLGIRWMAMYGIRRYLKDYKTLYSNPALAPFSDKQKTKNKSFFSSYSYNRWNNRNMEYCRLLGDLFGGGFGNNIGRLYSLFYLKDKNGKLKILTPGDLNSYADYELVTSELYDDYKRFSNDSLVCLDLFDRHVFAGKQFNARVIAINESWKTLKDGKIQIAAYDPSGAVIANQTVATGDIPPMTRPTKEWHLAIKSNAPGGWYKVDLFLYKNSDIVADNSYHFYVMPKQNIANTLPLNNKKIAIYDTNGKTLKVLKTLKLTPAIINNFNDLQLFDTLIIGAYSVDPKVKRGAEKIRNFIKGGGRLLQLEQHEGSIAFQPGMSITRNALGGSGITLVVPEHPVFNKIEDDELWDGWNGIMPDNKDYGYYGGVFGALISPLNKSLLAIGCIGTPRASDTAVQTLIADVKIGKGVALLSQPYAVARYGKDPVATKYIQNCFQYILSDETKYAEPVSAVNILNVDPRRCGYLTLKRSIPTNSNKELEKAANSGLKNCGGLRFKFNGKAMLIDKTTTFLLPENMNYMTPEWEKKKQLIDHDQGALQKNIIETLFLMARLDKDVAYGTTVGQVVFNFVDGSQHKHDVVSGLNIASPACKTDLEAALNIGDFFVSIINSGAGDKKLKSIVIEPTTGNNILLGGTTAVLYRPGSVNF